MFKMVVSHFTTQSKHNSGKMTKYKCDKIQIRQNTKVKKAKIPDSLSRQMIAKTPNQFTTEWFLAKSGTVLTHSKLGLTQPQLDDV